MFDVRRTWNRTHDGVRAVYRIFCTMKKLLITIVFLAGCGISSIHGQSGVGPRERSALELKVTEAGSGEPVQMATVYIIPAGDTLVTSFTFTDKAGTALLKDFAAGKYIVNIRHS